MFLLGEVLAAFGPSLAPPADSLPSGVGLAGAGAGGSGGPTGGASASGGSSSSGSGGGLALLGLGGSRKEDDGSQTLEATIDRCIRLGAATQGDAAVRAAATSALSRILEGAGPRAYRHHAAVLKHLSTVSSADRAHPVRAAVGPALQALAVGSCGFASVTCDALLRLAMRGLADPHPGVRLGHAHALASILATSVIATRVSAAAAHAAAAASRVLTLKGVSADGGDEDDDAPGGSSGAGAGDAGPPEGSGADGGGDGDDGAGGDGDAPVGSQVGGGKGKSGGSTFFARLKTGAKAKGNGDGSSAPPKRARRSSGGASGIGKAAQAALASLRMGAGGGSSRDRHDASFTLPSALSYLSSLLRQAGRVAHKSGVRVGDVRVAIAVAAGAMLRSLRVCTGAIPDSDVPEVLGCILSALIPDELPACVGPLLAAAASTGGGGSGHGSSSSSGAALGGGSGAGSGGAPATPGPGGSVPYLSALAFSGPAAGPHAEQLRAAVRHIITHGLLSPPAQLAGSVPAAWQRWQRLVLTGLSSALARHVSAAGALAAYLGTAVGESPVSFALISVAPGSAASLSVRVLSETGVSDVLLALPWSAPAKAAATAAVAARHNAAGSAAAADDGDIFDLTAFASIGGGGVNGVSNDDLFDESPRPSGGRVGGAGASLPSSLQAAAPEPDAAVGRTSSGSGAGPMSKKLSFAGLKRTMSLAGQGLKTPSPGGSTASSSGSGNAVPDKPLQLQSVVVPSGPSSPLEAALQSLSRSLPPSTQALLLSLQTEALPQAYQPGTPDGREPWGALLSTALPCLASPSVDVRRAAVTAVRVAAATYPALLPSLVLHCLSAVRTAAGELTSNTSFSAIALAAAASALADAASFASQRRAAGGSSFTRKLAEAFGAKAHVDRSGLAHIPSGAQPAMTHTGTSPLSTAIGGTGIPGAGPGSGTSVVTGAAAGALTRLHGHAGALASLIAVSCDLAATAGAGTIPSFVPPPSTPGGARRRPGPSASASAPRSVLHPHLLAEVLSAASHLLSFAHKMGPHATARASTLVAPLGVTPATSALVQAAASGAIAEARAGLIRSGCALLSSVIPAGAPWLTSAAVWPALHACLSSHLLAFRDGQDGSAMGIARDGSGAFALAPVGVPAPLAIVAGMAAAVRGSPGMGGGTATPHGGAMPVPGGSGSQASGKDEADPESAAGIATARNLYSGVAEAWAWSAHAAVVTSLASLTQAVAPSAPRSPEAAAQLYRCARVAVATVTAARAWPANLSASAAAPAATGGGKGSSRHRGPSRVFSDVTVATSVRAPAASAVTNGSGAGAGSGVGGPHADAASSSSLGALGAGVGAAASLTGAAPPPTDNPAAAAAGIGSYTPDDAQLYSPHGVSLAAIALARRSALHAAAAALEAVAAIPMHTLSTLPLRAPAVQAAVSVLTSGCVGIEPVDLGLVSFDPPPPPSSAGGQQQLQRGSPAAAATRDAGWPQLPKLDPRKLPSAEVSAAYDHRIALYLSGPNPASPSAAAGGGGSGGQVGGADGGAERWCPLSLALSGARAPRVSRSLSSLFPGCGVLTRGAQDAAAAACGDGADDTAGDEGDVCGDGGAALPPTLLALLSSQHFPGIDCDVALQLAVAGPPGGVGVGLEALGSSQAPSLWPLATLGSLQIMSGSPNDDPSAASALQSVGGRWGALLTSSALDAASLAPSHPVGASWPGGGGGSSPDPCTRAANASVAVLQRIAAVLQVGQVDALVGALSAPLRPVSAAQAADSVGSCFRFRAEAVNDADRAVVSRNVATAFLAILASLRPEHVLTGGGAANGAGAFSARPRSETLDTSGGGDDDAAGSALAPFSPVPWLLTVRGVLGAGMCSRDAATRRASAQGLAELVRLGGRSFARKLVAALEKQVAKASADSASAAAHDKAGAVGGGQANSMISALGRSAAAGAVYALACVKRSSALSAARSAALGEAAHALVASTAPALADALPQAFQPSLDDASSLARATSHNEAREALAAALVALDPPPLLVDGISDLTLFDACRESRQPVRSSALHAWRLLLDASAAAVAQAVSAADASAREAAALQKQAQRRSKKTASSPVSPSQLAAAALAAAEDRKLALAAVQALGRYVNTTLSLLDSHLLMPSHSPFDARSMLSAATDASGYDGRGGEPLLPHQLLRMQLTGRGLALVSASTVFDGSELTPDAMLSPTTAAAVGTDFPAGGAVVATSTSSAEAAALAASGSGGASSGAQYVVVSYDDGIESGLVASATASGSSSSSASSNGGGNGGLLSPTGSSSSAASSSGGGAGGASSAPPSLSAVLPVFDPCSGDLIPPASVLTPDAHGYAPTLVTHSSGKTGAGGRGGPSAGAMMLSPGTNRPDPASLAAASAAGAGGGGADDGAGGGDEGYGPSDSAQLQLSPQQAVALGNSFQLYRHYARLLTTVGGPAAARATAAAVTASLEAPRAVAASRGLAGALGELVSGSDAGIASVLASMLVALLRGLASAAPLWADAFLSSSSSAASDGDAPSSARAGSPVAGAPSSSSVSASAGELPALLQRCAFAWSSLCATPDAGVASACVAAAGLMATLASNVRVSGSLAGTAQEDALSAPLSAAGGVQVPPPGSLGELLQPLYAMLLRATLVGPGPIAASPAALSSSLCAFSGVPDDGGASAAAAGALGGVVDAMPLPNPFPLLLRQLASMPAAATGGAAEAATLQLGAWALGLERLGLRWAKSAAGSDTGSVGVAVNTACGAGGGRAFFTDAIAGSLSSGLVPCGMPPALASGGGGGSAGADGEVAVRACAVATALNVAAARAGRRPVGHVSSLFAGDSGGTLAACAPSAPLSLLTAFTARSGSAAAARARLSHASRLLDSTRALTLSAQRALAAPGSSGSPMPLVHLQSVYVSLGPAGDALLALDASSRDAAAAAVSRLFASAPVEGPEDADRKLVLYRSGSSSLLGPWAAAAVGSPVASMGGLHRMRCLSPHPAGRWADVQMALLSVAQAVASATSSAAAAAELGSSTSGIDASPLLLATSPGTAVTLSTSAAGALSKGKRRAAPQSLLLPLALELLPACHDMLSGGHSRSATETAYRTQLALLIASEVAKARAAGEGGDEDGEDGEDAGEDEDGEGGGGGPRSPAGGDLSRLPRAARRILADDTTSEASESAVAARAASAAQLALQADAGLWRAFPGDRARAFALCVANGLVAGWLASGGAATPSTSLPRPVLVQVSTLLQAAATCAAGEETGGAAAAADLDIDFGALTKKSGSGGKGGKSSSSSSSVAAIGDGSTSDTQVLGLALLSRLVTSLAPHRDPDVPSQPLLQQFQTLLVSAVAPHASPKGAPSLQPTALRLASLLVTAGIASDAGSVRTLASAVFDGVAAPVVSEGSPSSAPIAAVTPVGVRDAAVSARAATAAELLLACTVSPSGAFPSQRARAVVLSVAAPALPACASAWRGGLTATLENGITPDGIATASLHAVASATVVVLGACSGDAAGVATLVSLQAEAVAPIAASLKGLPAALAEHDAADGRGSLNDLAFTAALQATLTPTRRDQVSSTRQHALRALGLLLTQPSLPSVPPRLLLAAVRALRSAGHEGAFARHAVSRVAVQVPSPILGGQPMTATSTPLLRFIEVTARASGAGDADREACDALAFAVQESLASQVSAALASVASALYASTAVADSSSDEACSLSARALDTLALAVASVGADSKGTAVSSALGGAVVQASAAVGAWCAGISFLLPGALPRPQAAACAQSALTDAACLLQTLTPLASGVNATPQLASAVSPLLESVGSAVSSLASVCLYPPGQLSTVGAGTAPAMGLASVLAAPAAAVPALSHVGFEAVAATTRGLLGAASPHYRSDSADYDGGAPGPAAPSCEGLWQFGVWPLLQALLAPPSPGGASAAPAGAFGMMSSASKPPPEASALAAEALRAWAESVSALPVAIQAATTAAADAPSSSADEAVSYAAALASSAITAARDAAASQGTSAAGRALLAALLPPVLGLLHALPAAAHVAADDLASSSSAGHKAATATAVLFDGPSGDGALSQAAAAAIRLAFSGLSAAQASGDASPLAAAVLPAIVPFLGPLPEGYAVDASMSSATATESDDASPVLLDNAWLAPGVFTATGQAALHLAQSSPALFKSAVSRMTLQQQAALQAGMRYAVTPEAQRPPRVRRMRVASSSPAAASVGPLAGAGISKGPSSGAGATVGLLRPRLTFDTSKFKSAGAVPAAAPSPTAALSPSGSSGEGAPSPVAPGAGLAKPALIAPAPAPAPPPPRGPTLEELLSGDLGLAPMDDSDEDEEEEEDEDEGESDGEDKKGEGSQADEEVEDAGSDGGDDEGGAGGRGTGISTEVARDEFAAISEVAPSGSAAAAAAPKEANFGEREDEDDSGSVDEAAVAALRAAAEADRAAARAPSEEGDRDDEDDDADSFGGAFAEAFASASSPAAAARASANSAGADDGGDGGEDDGFAGAFAEASPSPASQHGDEFADEFAGAAPSPAPFGEAVSHASDSESEPAPATPAGGLVFVNEDSDDGGDDTEDGDSFADFAPQEHLAGSPPAAAGAAAGTAASDGEFDAAGAHGEFDEDDFAADFASAAPAAPQPGPAAAAVRSAGSPAAAGGAPTAGGDDDDFGDFE